MSRLAKPLAVLARDNEAVEVLEACFAGGLQVPEQVAVLGVDNTESVCDCLRVPLSSIDSNLEPVGYEGAALLERLIRGETAPASSIYVPPACIVERRSTDSLATDHPEVAAALQFIRDNANRQIGMIDIAFLVWFQACDWFLRRFTPPKVLVAPAGRFALLLGHPRRD